ncbi:uncharacterized protein [Diadema setosum]|uniref:uncharacterized protein n=1 Tax=Diadema setosum TaxID=31175 RepID=UPI003B3A4C40
MSPDRLATSLAWFLAFLLTFVVETSTNNSTQWPKGHLEVLGRHRPSDGHIEILDALPTPEEFWEKYAKNGVPVLFRGMSDNFAARQKWTDEYLSSNYGNLRVKIEAKAEKEYYPEGDKGVGQDTLQHFLDTYQSRNAYVVSQLPDPMSTEVSVPPFMTCGTFGQRLLEANLWFSSGGTKSLLHRDADNAINCLLFGTKDWIFIHPDHEDKIPIAKEAAQGYGGFALLNPDSVDLLTFSKFADVPWTHGNVTAGDCIFLPQGYWHQVRSYGSRNLAVSLLFSRLREVDLSDCEGARLSYKPLSEMEMVFTYDGYGEQTMGDTDPFELNDTIKEWCRGSENGMMDVDAIFEFLMKEYHDISEDEEEEEKINPDAILDIADKVVEFLDVNKDGYVSCEEVTGLGLKTLKTLANIIDSDPANTEQYEYAKFEPKDIGMLMQEVAQEAQKIGEDSITRQEFVIAYQNIGGSFKIGNEVFSKLVHTDNEDVVALDHFQQSVEEISELFSKKMKHEAVDRRWQEEGKEWMTQNQKHRHTEL